MVLEEEAVLIQVFDIMALRLSQFASYTMPHLVSAYTVFRSLVLGGMG